MKFMKTQLGMRLSSKRRDGTGDQSPKMRECLSVHRRENLFILFTASNKQSETIREFNSYV